MAALANLYQCRSRALARAGVVVWLPKKNAELAACKSLADYLRTALTNFDQCAACLGLSGCQKTFIFIVFAWERRQRVVQASKLL